MPSANPKQATEAEDPIRQAIKTIEHKIRNLEKRKTKLEGYKVIRESGKELNSDQKTAVAKYDEVLLTLEVTREIHKGVVTIANESAKTQKKLARKEALERMQQDITKVREVLLIQNTLINMGLETARNDFLNGSNGAVKLSEEDLDTLDNLFTELTVERQGKSGEATFTQLLQKTAEHFIAIVDGKQREFIGTTYLKMKELVNNINSCGYFDQVLAVDAPGQEAEETSPEARISNNQAPEQPTEDYNAGEINIPAPETSSLPKPNFPVQVSQVPVVSGPATVAGPSPVVAQPIPPHPATNLDTAYYVNAASYAPASQQTQQGPPLNQPQQPQLQQQQQQPQQPPQQPPQQQSQQQQQAPPRINDVIGNPDFFFLQESELDSPDVQGQSAPIVPHIPPAVNAPIPSQTYTNQSFAGPPVQVIYPHPPPPQDMPHIPGFANPNPPPPIPMPPSHQQPNLPYSPQHPAGYQQQAPNSQQLQQAFDPSAHQQDSQHSMEDTIEQGQATVGEPETNESGEWAQMSEQPVDDWGKSDIQESGQLAQHQAQQSQQAWGEQRGGYRGRGGRRVNTNGYNGRGRGGGYQQNGRGGSGGQGTYYRNDNGNYQNGYQQRSYNNDGSAGYNGGFIKQPRGGNSGGSRGGPRGERGGMDRGGRGGQYRGGQRGANRGGGGSGGGYGSRKNQAQQ